MPPPHSFDLLHRDKTDRLRRATVFTDDPRNLSRDTCVRSCPLKVAWIELNLRSGQAKRPFPGGIADEQGGIAMWELAMLQRLVALRGSGLRDPEQRVGRCDFVLCAALNLDPRFRD